MCRLHGSQITFNCPGLERAGNSAGLMAEWLHVIPRSQRMVRVRCSSARVRFETFLDTGGYTIIWTVLGCKQIVGQRAPRGELHLNGAFRYMGGVPEGSVKGTYCEYPDPDQ